MSRFVQNTNVQKVNHDQFSGGNERTDGKRWNRAITDRFSEILIDPNDPNPEKQIKSRDGLRRVERAKDKTPDAVAVKKRLDEQRLDRFKDRTMHLTPEQKLTIMINNAFGKDR